MKAIKDIIESIREELEGSEHYAKKAAELRPIDREMANTYAEMARQELLHVDRLHAMAVKLINEQRAQGVAPPTAMQAVWDWEHSKMIDTTARIKALLDMAK